MQTVNREEWGARAARGGPGNLDPAEVVGIALHWPGLTRPVTGVSRVSELLRGWQRMHMDDRGWSDIAYQMAFDQDGNTYVLRGLRKQSGANGDTDVNEAYGAFLLVLAPGEHPSDAMLTAVRKSVSAFRLLYPKGRQIVGHRDVRPEPTDCPGDTVMRAIRLGMFEPKIIPPAPKPPAKPVRVTQVDRATDALTQALKALRKTLPARKGARAEIPAIRKIRNRLKKKA